MSRCKSVEISNSSISTRDKLRSGHRAAPATRKGFGIIGVGIIGISIIGVSKFGIGKIRWRKPGQPAGRIIIQTKKIVYL